MTTKYLSPGLESTRALREGKSKRHTEKGACIGSKVKAWKDAQLEAKDRKRWKDTVVALCLQMTKVKGVKHFI